MNHIGHFLHSQTPTAMRPLLGLTILLVEDSLTACEAMRLMCLRSGGRIRRADCLESARRHLQVYRPSIVITDMGLPDGSGADLISEITQGGPTVEVVLGLSADPDQAAVAMAAGAHGFIAKPIQSIAEFQATILAYLPDDRQPKGPRRVDASTIHADKLAIQEDLAMALNM
ncbi:MAG: response regulator, partial [Pseudomonadota bacterium]